MKCCSAPAGQSSTGRLVEGRFPDYRQVLPKKQTVKVPLQVPSFTAAVRQAKIMTDEESKRVVFKFAKAN